MMEQKLKRLMMEAGYAAPELAGRAKKLTKLLISDIINDVSQYGCWGESFEKETYEDGFINGTKQGYTDAVEQIVNGLKDRYGLSEECPLEEKV